MTFTSSLNMKTVNGSIQVIKIKFKRHYICKPLTTLECVENVPQTQHGKLGRIKINK